MTTLYRYETQGREVTYLDADDAYAAEDIRRHWSETFPELSNATADTQAAPEGETLEAVVEGETVQVDRVVTFAKRVGTKG